MDGLSILFSLGGKSVTVVNWYSKVQLRCGRHLAIREDKTQAPVRFVFFFREFVVENFFNTLGVGFKHLLFSQQTLGKCSNLTSIFSGWFNHQLGSCYVT